MVEARRFPPPWSVEETDACFIVRDGKGQTLAYAYFSNRPFLGGRAASDWVCPWEVSAVGPC